MATLRIDQATPGPGTDGQSRHDLIPGEVITLVATAPTGPGITYTWEILDKAGSTAVLSATTGISVSIGLAAAITQPCAFLIKLTVNDNGTVTETVRIASVRTLSTALRLPLFPETAPTSGRLNSNTPDQSTDNAYYPNRAGTGAAGQNWRGWSEWAYELTLAVEAAAGGGGGTGLRYHIPAPDVVTVTADHQYLVQGSLIVDPGATFTVQPGGQLVILP